MIVYISNFVCNIVWYTVDYTYLIYLQNVNYAFCNFVFNIFDILFFLYLFDKFTKKILDLQTFLLNLFFQLHHFYMIFACYIYKKYFNFKNLITESILSATWLLIFSILFPIYLICYLLYLFDIFKRNMLVL